MIAHRHPEDNQLPTCGPGGPPPATLDLDTPRCPYCGAPAAPYDPQVSAVLDQVAELAAALRTIQRIAEGATA
jgi:hypothetical protein